MFSYESIEKYHADLLNGTTSCVDAVQHYLHRIRETSHLNAFVRTYEQEALQRAAELDQQRHTGKKPGRLHGVVVYIKDVLCYRDHHVYRGT